MTSNEIRQIVGMMPSKDPGADELRNKNLNQSTEEMNAEKQPEEIQNENEVKVWKTMILADGLPKTT